MTKVGQGKVEEVKIVKSKKYQNAYGTNEQKLKNLTYEDMKLSSVNKWNTKMLLWLWLKWSCNVLKQQKELTIDQENKSWSYQTDNNTK